MLKHENVPDLKMEQPMFKARQQIASPSRRSMLTGTATALAGLAALTATGALTAIASDTTDSKLVALCDEFIAVDKHVWSMAGENETIVTEEIREAAQEPFFDRICQIANEVAETKSATLAGHAAKARLLVALNDDSGNYKKVLGSLLNDLAAA
jgi:hypothetical protein